MSADLSFTVLMAVYYKDSPRLFSKALYSIFSNSVKPFEVILVCDGPLTDSLENVIYEAEYKFPCLKVIRLHKNIGLAGALNYGLKHITTTWVFRADADDINLPDRFHKSINFIANNPDIDIFGGAILEVDSLGNPISIKIPPVKYIDIVRCLKFRNPFNHMTVAFKCNKVLNLGGYPNIYLREDYGLWILMLSTGAKAANLNSILVHASAGRDLYNRRGGIKYAINEFTLQNYLVRYRFKSKLSALLTGTIKFLIFISPVLVRGYIYRIFLRDKVKY